MTIVFGFVLAWYHKATMADIRGFLEAVLPALVALAGSAVGYYFGTRSQPL